MHDMIEPEKEITLRKYTKLRIRGLNIFSVEDEDNLYYVYTCRHRPFMNFLAFTRDNPERKESINCIRLIEKFGDVTEQTITTHKVRRVKKIANSLYKIKTNHNYYMLKV